MSLTKLKELTVLGAVRDHPMHGYGLADTLEKHIGWALGLKKSAIYAMLRRFERQGLVSRDTSKASNYPERHTFHITETGRQAVLNLKSRAFEDTAAPNLPLAVVLMHMDDLPSQARAAALQRLKDWRVSRIEGTEHSSEHDGAAEVALELIADQLRLEIEYIDRLLAGSDL